MRLLVVEDEKGMAELLRKGLEEEGYVVAVAADGPTAFEMAQASEQLREEAVARPKLMSAHCDLLLRSPSAALLLQNVWQCSHWRSSRAKSRFPKFLKLL